MEVDSFWQKGAKGKGNKGGDGKQKSDIVTSEVTTFVTVATEARTARKAKAATTRAKAKDNRETTATKVKAETRRKERTRRTPVRSKILGRIRGQPVAKPILRKETHSWARRVGPPAREAQTSVSGSMWRSTKGAGATAWPDYAENTSCGTELGSHRRMRAVQNGKGEIVNSGHDNRVVGENS